MVGGVFRTLIKLDRPSGITLVWDFSVLDPNPDYFCRTNEIIAVNNYYNTTLGAWFCIGVSRDESGMPRILAKY